jgi:hypothetical protein
LNYVSSGYTLQASYLADSNATTWARSDSWLRHWPSAFVGGIKPTCQPSSIPLGTRTVTNNSALAWTITNVTLHTGDDVESLSSLVYQSNLLRDCKFRSVTIYLDSYLGGRNAPQVSWSTWGAEVEGIMYCEVHNSARGVTFVNLTADYNLLPRSAFENNETFRFPGRDQKRYSLWWGESLLSAAWWDFVNIVAANAQDFVGGVIAWEPNMSSGATNQDFLTRALFLPVPYAGDNAVSIGTPIINTFPGVPDLTPGVTYMYSAEPALPTSSALLKARDLASDVTADPWIIQRARTLGIVFLSTLWTDLGQFNQNNNILDDPGLLQKFSQNLTDIRLGLKDNQTIGPELSPYFTSPETDAQLGVIPSILVTDYLCQVPQRKPWGSLITSVLVADLVFLRTLWAIISFIARHFAQRHDPLANSCETCLRRFDVDGDYTDDKHVSASASGRGSISLSGDHPGSQYILLGEHTSETPNTNTTSEQNTEMIVAPIHHAQVSVAS